MGASGLQVLESMVEIGLSFIETKWEMNNGYNQCTGCKDLVIYGDHWVPLASLLRFAYSCQLLPLYYILPKHVFQDSETNILKHISFLINQLVPSLILSCEINGNYFTKKA